MDQDSADMETGGGVIDEGAGTPVTEKGVDPPEMTKKPKALSGNSEEAKRLKRMCVKCFQSKIA